MLQLRREVADLIRILLALDVARNFRHRTRPVQGYSGDDVLQALRLEFFHKGSHAGGFQLEYSDRPTFADHVIDLGIVKGQRIDLDLDAAVLPDHGHGILHDGEGAQPQKVHLEQSQFLQGAHGELGDNGFLVALQRDILHQGAAGNHDAGGMSGGMARQAFEAQGNVDQLRHPGVGLIGILKLRIHLQRLLNGNAQNGGDHLGNLVHLAVGIHHGTADIPDAGPGRHGPKGYNLGHVVLAVLVHHVVNDFLAPFIAEVRVNIGHGDPLRVQKAFKDEIVPDRIDLGNIQGIGDDGRGGRAPAGAGGDAVVIGELDEIPDNQEIVDIAHPLENPQLIGQPLNQNPAVARIQGIHSGHDRFRHRQIPELGKHRILAGQALIAALLEIPGMIRPLRQVKGRKPGHMELVVKLTLLGDLHRIFQRFGHMGKQLPHLLRTLEIELRRRILHPVRLIHGGRGLNAQEDIMAAMVIPGQIVHVVGSHQRDVQFAGQFDVQGIYLFLLGQAVVLQLQIEAVPERIPVEDCRGAGLLREAVIQILLNLTAQAGRQGNQALAVTGQKGVVHPGLIVEAPDRGLTDNAHQILVARFVLDQKHQMMNGVVGQGAILHIA
ncbi:hypothetical protein DSECCO2_228730 [anaerobic digester metagenome]